jgi:bifunctional non-homologous end joining protein LigD
MAAKAEFRDAKLSNPAKVFWPAEGYTKLNLANFYRSVFPLLQPYVKDRILTLERCPDGMNGQCFYQKEKPQSMPANTPTKRIPVHVTGSRGKTFPKPDWVCFDLDPASGKFRDAAEAGSLLGELLDKLGLESFPKTSGSRGLHVFVPIRVGPGADEVLRFAEKAVARLAAAHPKLLTTEHSIAARGKRVYLDPFRNGSVQTVVSPYSVRRKPHAPVSTPLAWREVERALDPADFNLGNFGARQRGEDPWKRFFQTRQNLDSARGRLEGL